MSDYAVDPNNEVEMRVHKHNNYSPEEIFIKTCILELVKEKNAISPKELMSTIYPYIREENEHLIKRCFRILISNGRIGYDKDLKVVLVERK